MKTEKKLNLHHFLEEREEKMPIEEEVDDGVELENVHNDSNKYQKEMKKLIQSCDIIL